MTESNIENKIIEILSTNSNIETEKSKLLELINNLTESFNKESNDYTSVIDNRSNKKLFGEIKKKIGSFSKIDQDIKNQLIDCFFDVIIDKYMDIYNKKVGDYANQKKTSKTNEYKEKLTLDNVYNKGKHENDFKKIAKIFLGKDKTLEEYCNERKEREEKEKKEEEKEADKKIKDLKKQNMAAKECGEVVSFFIESNSECKKYIFSELIKLEQHIKNKTGRINNNLSTLIEKLIEERIKEYLEEENNDKNKENFIEFVKIGKSYAQKYFKKFNNIINEEKDEEKMNAAKDEINEIATEQFKIEIKGKSDKRIIELITSQDYDSVIKNTEEDFGFKKGSELDTIVKMMRLNNKISQNKENRKENIDELIDIINNFLEENLNDDLKKYSDIKAYLDENLTDIKHLFVDENGKIDIENINYFIEKIEQFDDYKNYFKDIIYAKLHEDILHNKNELINNRVKELKQSKLNGSTNNSELSDELIKSELDKLEDNHFDNFFKEDFLSTEDKMQIMLHILKTIITDKEHYKYIKNYVFDNFIDVFEKLGSDEFKSIFEQYAEFSGYNLSQFSGAFVELIKYCDENGKVEAGEKIFKVVRNIFNKNMKINKKFSKNNYCKTTFNNVYKNFLIQLSSQLLNGKYELKNDGIIESCEKIVIKAGEKIIKNYGKNTRTIEYETNVVISYLNILNKQGMLKDKKKNILKKIKNEIYRNLVNKEIENIEKKNEVIVNEGKSEGNEKIKIQHTDFVKENESTIFSLEKNEKNKNSGIDIENIPIITNGNEEIKAEIIKKENGEVIKKDNSTDFVTRICGKYNFDFKYNNVEYTCSYDTKSIIFKDKEGNKINKEEITISEKKLLEVLKEALKDELEENKELSSKLENENSLEEFLKGYVNNKEKNRNTTTIGGHNP